jgi:hypothetical protein
MVPTQLTLGGFFGEARRSRKIQGYLGKWVDAKYLLGCALFIDVLTPYSMQDNEVDILGTLT